MSKHTPMVPAGRAGLAVVRARSEVGAAPSWVPELGVVLHELEDRRWSGVRDARRRSSNRTVRYRARAALRIWRSMW